MKYVSILGLVLALGCGGEEQASTAEAPTTANAPGETMEATPAAMAEVGAAAPSAMTAAPAAGSGMAPENMGEALAGLAEATSAAAAAPSTGDNCGDAYTQMMAMMEQMEARFGMGTSMGSPPSRDQFLEVCGQLPAEAQQCMVMNYAMAHQAECQTVMQSPEVQRVRQMFRPGGQ